MKKKIKPNRGHLTVILFSGCLTAFTCTRASAQFLGGFFSQQSDKQQAMMTQIAGYQTYLGAIKTGYQVCETGLTTVNTMKTGSFTLNSDYFSSLTQVSAAVQNDPKGKAIAAAYQQIVTLFTVEINWQQQQKALTSAELSYLQAVYQNLLQKAQADLSQATQILTPGKLQMTDAQRISQLQSLYTSIQDKQAFASSFTTKCRKLALSRQQSTTDRATLKTLYGIQ